MDNIDILMATYNGESFIKEQLDSIISQTYSEWILYISDDGSTDGTLEIIKEYVEKDSRINLVPHKKSGNARDNFLYLLKFSKSKYVMFCDQDDLWLENKVKNAYKNIKKVESLNYNKPILIYTDLEVVDQTLNRLDKSYFHFQDLKPCNAFEKILIQNCVTGCTMIFNNQLKELTISAKNFDYIIMHDWWMALISSCFGHLVLADTIDIRYRQHRNNSVGAQNTRSILYILKRFMNISKIKRDIKNTQLQAMHFYVTFKNYKGLSQDQIKCLEFANNYSQCLRKSKFNRLRFYKNNHIKKNSLIKTIGWYIGG